MQILHINEPFISANLFYSGVHWSKRKKVADYWHELVYLSCLEQKIKPVKSYPITINYACLVKNKRRDIDNIMATIKLINDGLKYAGIIKDDSISYVNEINIKVIAGNKDNIILSIC
jgi:Holliday junction resolvase RusA-like endonuclease